MPSAEETTYLIEMVPDAAMSHHHHHHHHHHNQDGGGGFTSRDVDALVSRIKENLRLSNLKSRSSLAVQKMRRAAAAPYKLPARGACGTAACELCSRDKQMPGAEVESEDQRLARHRAHRHISHADDDAEHQRYLEPGTWSADWRTADDSYESFQSLLRQGALIKEAVKRLRTSARSDLSLDSMDDEELDAEEEEDEEEDLDEDEAEWRRQDDAAAARIKVSLEPLFRPLQQQQQQQQPRRTTTTGTTGTTGTTSCEPTSRRDIV